MTPNIRTTDGRAALAKALKDATPGKWSHVYIPGRRTPGWPGEPGEHRLVANGNQWAPISAHEPNADGLFIAMAHEVMEPMLAYIADLESRLQAADELADAAKYFRDGVIATWHKKRVMDLDERNEALRNRLLDYDAAVKR